MTAVFDATGTIRAVAGQANLLDKDKPGSSLAGSSDQWISKFNILRPGGRSARSGLYRISGRNRRRGKQG